MCKLQSYNLLLRFKIKAFLVSFVCFYFITSGFPYAEGIPQQINYQGKLFENNKAVSGTKTFRFRFSEGNWSETHENVDVENGYYNVILGKKEAIPQEIFNNHSELHLEISVDGSVLSPQIDIVSVAYAFKAAVSDNTQKIAGNPVTGMPQKDQVLQWNGTEWTPETLVKGVKTVSVGSGLSGGGSSEEPTVSIADFGISGKHLAANIVDSSKILDGSIQEDDIGFSFKDNLGNHTATQNIKMYTHWLSHDGNNEGIYVAENGNVGVGTNMPDSQLDIQGDMNVQGNSSMQSINSINTNGLPFLKGYIKGCEIEWHTKKTFKIHKGMIEVGNSLLQINSYLLVEHKGEKEGLYAIYIKNPNEMDDHIVTGEDLLILNYVIPEWDRDQMGWYQPLSKKNRCIGFYYYTGDEIVRFHYHNGIYQYIKMFTYTLETGSNKYLEVKYIPRFVKKCMAYIYSIRGESPYLSRVYVSTETISENPDENDENAILVHNKIIHGGSHSVGSGDFAIIPIQNITNNQNGIIYYYYVRGYDPSTYLKITGYYWSPDKE